MRRRWLVAVVLAAGACSSDPAPQARATTTTTTTTSAEARTRAMAEAPIAGRIAAGAVWTGEEVVVWGGLARTGGIAEVTDGAAYDPSTDTWRTIAAPPTGEQAVGAASAWTGTEAVFWAGNSPDGPTVGAAYDPKADRWRALPLGPLGAREGEVSAWTGKELVIAGGAGGDTMARPLAAALDPATDTWRLLPGLNRYLGLAAWGAVWHGHEVFLVGNLALCTELDSRCHHTRPIFLAYDPATDVVRELDLDGRSALRPVGWSGAELVLLDEEHHRVVRWSEEGAWRDAEPPTCRPEDDPLDRQSAWLGDRLVLSCGDDRVQVYDVATDRWQLIRTGTTPLQSRSGSVVVWTGRRLVAWSGTVRQPGNPTPADGVVLDLLG